MGNLATVTNIKQVAQSMPSDNGYVNVWRDIKKQPFYKSDDHIARSMFLDMLLDAQYKSKVIQVAGVDIILNTGQLFTKKGYFMDQGISESKTRTRLTNFEKLGIISRQTIYDNSNRPIGQRITFLNWNKWQKVNLPSNLPVNLPETANIKGLNRGVNLPSNLPVDSPCNKVSNNKDIKDNDRQANRLLVKKAFEHTWKRFKEVKKSIGKIDTSPKTKTFEKKFQPLFNEAYFKKHSEDEFKAEINTLCKFITTAHKVEGFNRFQNMQLITLLGEKQWRD